MKKLFIIFFIIAVSLAYGVDSYGTEDVSSDSIFFQLAKEVQLFNVEKIVLILKNEGDTNGSYQIRMYPCDKFEDYIYEGTATSTADSLVDSGATFAVNLVGQTIYNITDGSSGTITDTTSTNIYATLFGGTDNTWTTGDYYKIRRPLLYYSPVTDTLATGIQDVITYDNYYRKIGIYIKKTTSADSTSEFKVQYHLK